jgi:hypothetical protein
VSRFRPSFPPQPRVYFRNQPCLPSSVRRNANISPRSSGFFSPLATHHSPLPVAEHFASRVFINLQIPLFPPSICNPPVISRLQIPLFATPLFSHRYKTPGGVGGSDFQFSPRCLCASVANPMFSAVCRLFALSLRSFPHSFPLFSTAWSLFSQNTRGWGVSSASTAKTKTKGHAGACPFHNSSQLRVNYAPAPFEKLPTASASVLYTSKTVRSLVICRTS